MRGCFGYKLKLVRNQGYQLPGEDEFPGNLTRFSFKSLKKATKNFRTEISNSFFSWYKGTLEDGSVVIINVVPAERQNIDIIPIIKLMSGIKHRNVVELIGYCIEDDHRMLVHEFVGDYSLDQLLHSDSGVEHTALDWPVRASVCLGVARGLEYLHRGISPRVVSRDVKPGNVLLDGSFNPKLVNSVITCVIDDSESHHSDAVRGTIGFLDPEYLSTGRFSEKADVFSFGVLLLEVVSGRKAFSLERLVGDDEVLLVNWVRELNQNGRILEIVDPTLGEYPVNEVLRFVNVALFCTQASSDHRPSMFEVRHMLSGDYDSSRKVLGRPWDSRPSSNDDELDGPAPGNLIDI